MPYLGDINWSLLVGALHKQRIERLPAVEGNEQ